MTEPRSNDLVRIVFAIIFICGLIGASLWIVKPFLMAIIWATMIVIPTWPILLFLQKRLRNKRSLAVAAMSLLLLGFVFVPLLAAVGAVVNSADAISAKFTELEHAQIPPPPAWVGGIPLIGAKAAATWQGFAGDGLKDLVTTLTPYTNAIVTWLKASVGGIGRAFIQFILTVIVAAVLYSNGEMAADRVCRFARRLGGDKAENAVQLAGKAVKSVALGVVVTAVAQSVISGIGLAIAGVPFPAVLTVVMLILCIAQIGPLPVLAVCVAWLYSTGDNSWGTFLLVWTIVFGPMDNIVRPILIRKGVDLPMLLIFTGVIGGLITMGMIGLFVGPVILAVSHTLLESWIDGPKDAAQAGETS